MSLNIKDPEALRLARTERHRNKASVDELPAIADGVAAHLKRPMSIMESYCTTTAACLCRSREAISP